MAKSKRKRAPKSVPQITRSRTFEIWGLEQPNVGEFKALVRPCRGKKRDPVLDLLTRCHS
jgi:hypothetical protein